MQLPSADATIETVTVHVFVVREEESEKKRKKEKKINERENFCMNANENDELDPEL